MRKCRRFQAQIQTQSSTTQKYIFSTHHENQKRIGSGNSLCKGSAKGIKLALSYCWPRLCLMHLKIMKEMCFHASRVSVRQLKFYHRSKDSNYEVGHVGSFASALSLLFLPVVVNPNFQPIHCESMVSVQ